MPFFPDSRPRDDESIDAETFEERKRFSRFRAKDAELLGQLRETFELNADSVVDAFYEHLSQSPRLDALLSSAGAVDRLKVFQREYLLRLVQGRYDEDYAQNRRKIGRTHARIGLDPEWYLGTYGLYLDLLVPMIHERFGPASTKGIDAGVALAKLFILDMQLVLDAYYEKREKRAVERSEQLAAVGALAASIAHEVRNPLAGMKGALQVLRKDLEAGNQEVADEVVAQVDRLERLVRDLLDFATPRAIVSRTFDLHELLDRTLRLYKDDIDALGIEVRRAYRPGTARMSADPAQIEQVFLNLIHNAVQAMGAGGTLSVSTRAASRAITITFRDSGPGIPPENLERVYQPFFTTKHRGSGLGLSIVRKIVEAHGGDLQIRSEGGKGATVIVGIPDQEASAR